MTLPALCISNDPARFGLVDELRRTGRINNKISRRDRPIEIALLFGDRELAAHILAFPELDVNKIKRKYVCFLAPMDLLVHRPDFDPSTRDARGRTYLWYFAHCRFANKIMFLIACGKDLNENQKGLAYDDPEARRGVMHTPMEACVAQANNLESGDFEGTMALLRDFEDNPDGTRHALRLKLGIFLDGPISLLFAMMVSVCDGHLQPLPRHVWAQRTEKERLVVERAQRFFGIASRLPMELQAVLCSRTCGLAKDAVPSKDLDAAFRTVLL
jgi:hypothetical protein